MERIDLGEVPYLEAVDLMGQWVQQRQEGLIEDRLVLLTHPAVPLAPPAQATAPSRPPN